LSLVEKTSYLNSFVKSRNSKTLALTVRWIRYGDLWW